MIRLLRFLLTGDGHMHRWEIMSKAPLTWRVTWRGSKIGNYYECRCSVCGKIKEFKT